MPKLIQVLYGPLKDQRIHMLDADADQAIADGWAIDPHAEPIEPPFDVTVPANADRVLAAAQAGAAKLRAAEAPPPLAVPPVITALLPASCTIGDPDFTLFVTGSRFTATSVIHFADHDEPTTLNGDGTLSTGVKPSLWAAPAVVQCSVVNDGVSSNALTFEFLAPADLMRSRARDTKPWLKGERT